MANLISIPAEIAVGVGVGQAVSDVVEPKLRNFRNEQSAAHANVPLPAMQAALALIKGIPTVLDLAQEAAYDGFDGRRLGVLEQLLREYPGTAELLELWRRERLTRDDVDLALQRHGYPELYRNAVLELFYGRLSPEIVATAVQRGILPNDGILPVGPPTGGGKVPPMPMVDLDPFAEAKAEAVDEARLKVLARIVGLPASPDLAARATYRGIIDRVDFDRAIAEGNTRNEWRDAIFEAFREILTANQYAELELRGYLTRDERLARTRKHGMSDADSDLLYDVLGRSIPVHQIETGQARGGVYDGPTDGIPAPYLAAMRRGNLRPEYYNLAYANRYTYPSGFMIRGLAQDGELTQAETHQILLEVGWSPKWAETFSVRWTGGVAAVTDPNVKKAQNQLWTSTHRSFVAGELDVDVARNAFDQLAIPADAQNEILNLWLTEREHVRKQLTPTQIKKAYAEPVTNPATGQHWTREEALAALIGLGYSAADATTFLEL